MNRPENLIGLTIENTTRIDKMLIAIFQWNAILYTASSKFSLSLHGPEIEEKIKECMADQGWDDAAILGGCEAGVILFKLTEKNLQSRLFFYDLLRNRCGYADPIGIGPSLIYYKVTHV